MKKTIWIITLFPEYFTALQNVGVLGKALRGERALGDFETEIKVLNLRDYSNNNYKGVDDSPFGGGNGMVLRADILKNAIVQGVCGGNDFELAAFKKKHTVVFPCPRGTVWNTVEAKKFAETEISNSEKDLVFICGRYEGIDERFLDLYVDHFYSLGDYILTGGELAVMVMIDSCMRFVSGVLGNKLSADDESFSDGLLEEPQYTRPRVFDGVEVPEILLSGHHEKIKNYQHQEKLKMTKKYRKDLWDKYNEK